MSPGVAGYRATRVIDKELVGPSMTYAMLQSMSAMPDHDKQSVEEMRYDAWSKAGEPGQAAGQQGAFGSQAGAFGSTGGAFGGSGFGGGTSTSPSGFGQPSSTTSAFGQTQAASPFGGGSFGATTTSGGFGSSPGTSAFGGGGGGGTGGGLFGQQASTQGGGAFGSAGAASGGFGGGSAFGSGQQQTGGAAFGSGGGAASGASPFGASAQSGGMFGNQSQQNQTSAFGQPSQTPGFGSQQQQSGGLFGAKPATTSTGGPFGSTLQQSSGGGGLFGSAGTAPGGAGVLALLLHQLQVSVGSALHKDNNNNNNKMLLVSHNLLGEAICLERSKTKAVAGSLIKAVNNLDLGPRRKRRRASALPSSNKDQLAGYSVLSLHNREESLEGVHQRRRVLSLEVERKLRRRAVKPVSGPRHQREPAASLAQNLQVLLEVSLVVVHSNRARVVPDWVALRRAA